MLNNIKVDKDLVACLVVAMAIVQAAFWIARREGWRWTMVASSTRTADEAPSLNDQSR